MTNIKKGAVGLLKLVFPKKGVKEPAPVTFDGIPITFNSDFGFGFVPCDDAELDEESRTIECTILIESVFTTEQGRVRYEKKKEAIGLECRMIWNNSIIGIDYGA